MTAFLPFPDARRPAPRRRPGWPGSWRPWPSRVSTSARPRGSTRAGSGHLQPERYADARQVLAEEIRGRCLREYAETFPVVGGDFASTSSPRPSYWKRLFDESPAALKFGLKVPEEITAPKWPGHARYGTRPARSTTGSSTPTCSTRCSPGRWSRIATASPCSSSSSARSPKSTFPKPDDFLARLDPFLARLPRHFRYAVEIRNPEYLGPDYFSLLSRTTLRTSSTPGRACPNWLDRSTCRAPSRPISPWSGPCSKGRTYEQAVKALSPYERVQEPNPPAREGMGQIADRSWKRSQPAYVFVNNRLEGNAPATIEAVADPLLA